MKYAAFLQRNGHNIGKLAAEKGVGDLTDRFLRESVNLAQGGYRYDQVPVFTDSPVGRILFITRSGVPRRHGTSSVTCSHRWRNDADLRQQRGGNARRLRSASSSR